MELVMVYITYIDMKDSQKQILIQVLLMKYAKLYKIQMI